MSDPKINLYWATHPDQPNNATSARSRVLHVLDKTGKFQLRRGNKKRYTACGMIAVEMFKNSPERDICQNCKGQMEE